MVLLINSILVEFFRNLGAFLPNFIGGLLILIIGLLLGGLVKHGLMTIFTFVKIDSLLHRTKLIKKEQMAVWLEVLTEILKWMLIIGFLIPALEIWGLTNASAVLNQFLFYLPNVIVAVIIAFFGILASNLAYDVVRHSFKTIGAGPQVHLATFTRWVILFFTTLIVLNQLGVAQDLIKILFTGIVAMLALAGGLAFGLGGKEVARELLEGFKKRLES